MTTGAAPLILTLALDERSFHFFNTQRQLYFPVNRNFLSAHLTLFHHLPPAEGAVVNNIKNLCLQQTVIALPVTAVANIGRGVAYKMESRELGALHQNLQKQWYRWLMPQDRQKLWPHVTVQNKAAPDEALLLQQKLQKSFVPFTTFGTGLTLWAYQNGPWQWLQTFPFQPAGIE